MMKRVGKLAKQVLGAAAAALLLPAVCLADISPEEVYGKWKHEETGTNFDTWKEGFYEQYYEFGEDGTFTYEVYLDGKFRGEASGTYSVAGSKVSVTRTGGDSYSLNGLSEARQDDGTLALLVGDDNYYYREDDGLEAFGAGTSSEEDAGSDELLTLEPFSAASGETWPGSLNEDEQKLVGYWKYNKGEILMEFNADHTLFQDLQNYDTVSGTWEWTGEKGKYSYTLLGKTEDLQLVEDAYSGQTDLIVNFMDNTFTVTKQAYDEDLLSSFTGRWSGTDKNTASTMLLELRPDYSMQWSEDGTVRTGTWNPQRIISGEVDPDLYISFDDGEREFALGEPQGEDMRFTFGSDSKNTTLLHKAPEEEITAQPETEPETDAAAGPDFSSLLQGLEESISSEKEAGGEETAEEDAWTRFGRYIMENGEESTGDWFEGYVLKVDFWPEESAFEAYYGVKEEDLSTLYFDLRFKQDQVPEGMEYYLKSQAVLSPETNSYEVNIEGDMGESGIMYIDLWDDFVPEEYAPGNAPVPENLEFKLNGTTEATLDTFDSSSYVDVLLTTAVQVLEKDLETADLGLTIADFGFTGM